MNNKKFISLITLSVIFVLFLMNTNPNQVSLAMLLIPFIFIGLFIFLILKLSLDLLNRGKNNKKDFIFSVAASVILVNFLILNSVRQLTIQDGIISVAITLILAFYVGKFQLKAR